MSKVLVAYFSASGVTAKLAKRLAEAIGAVFRDFHSLPYLVVRCPDYCEHVSGAV